jgi:hypothetical protein
MHAVSCRRLNMRLYDNLLQIDQHLMVLHSGLHGGMLPRQTLSSIGGDPAKYRGVPKANCYRFARPFTSGAESFRVLTCRLVSPRRLRNCKVFLASCCLDALLAHPSTLLRSGIQLQHLRDIRCHHPLNASLTDESRIQMRTFENKCTASNLATRKI